MRTRLNKNYIWKRVYFGFINPFARGSVRLDYGSQRHTVEMRQLLGVKTNKGVCEPLDFDVYMRKNL